MKKIYSIAVIALLAGAGMSAVAFAQSVSQDPDVAVGQALWSQLQAHTLPCDQLTQTNFENLGDYFMQQMMGDAHEVMDQAMAARLGDAGLEQMHVVMGERFSGCNPQAAFPVGMMSGGMMGGYATTADANSAYPARNGYGWSIGGMMGWGYPLWGMGGVWGFALMIIMMLVWALIIAGLIAGVMWLVRGGNLSHRRHGSALDITKERYAKGEINREEFEKLKKDLADEK